MNPEYVFNQISGMLFTLIGLTVIAGSLTHYRVTCRMAGFLCYAPIGIITATCGIFIFINAGVIK